MNKSLVSTAEFAKKVGVTQRSVSQAITDGRLHSVEMVNGQWLIDEKKGLQEWKQNTRRALSIPTSPEEASKRLHHLKDHPNEITGIEARALKDYFQTLNLEVKYLASTGEYIHINDAKRDAETMANEIKLLLNALPTEIYLGVAHIVDKDQLLQIEEVAKRAVNASLQKLCAKVIKNNTGESDG